MPSVSQYSCRDWNTTKYMVMLPLFYRGRRFFASSLPAYSHGGQRWRECRVLAVAEFGRAT